ncbi:hypothetical protein ACVGXH_00565, partial [Enterobacter intestinihominis]
AKRERSGHSPAFPESCFFCPRFLSTPASGTALIRFHIVFDPFNTIKIFSKLHGTIALCLVINPTRHLDHPIGGFNIKQTGLHHVVI